MSRRERRALALLLGLGVAGHLIRATAAPPPPPSIAAQLFDPATDGNPLAHRDSIRKQALPLGPNERIDIDRAPVGQLERLPGIGPAIAKRIVAERESHGQFGTLDGLRRVKGLAAGLIAKLAPHLSFGGVPAEAQRLSMPDALDLNLATIAQLDSLPGVSHARAKAIVAFRDSAGPFRQFEDLKRVHGITPALLRLLEGRLVIP